MALIDKDSLVAKIENRIKETESTRSMVDPFWEGQISAFDSVLKILDTLETKVVNLENSMTCEVGWYDGFLLDYTQEQQDELLKKIGANVGDKIRVILAKE